MIDSLILKLIHQKRVEKRFLGSHFSTLCKQVVVKPHKTSHVLTQNQFSKVNRNVRKHFFCELRDIYISKDNKDSHEFTPDH